MNLYLSHSQFAESIGIELSSLLKIELGKLTVTDGIVSLICKKYNVNELWLRFGIGETFCLASEQINSKKMHQLTPLQISIINTIINSDKKLLNETMLQFLNFINLISNNIVISKKKKNINKSSVEYSMSETEVNKKKIRKLLFLLNT